MSSSSSSLPPYLARPLTMATMARLNMQRVNFILQLNRSELGSGSTSHTFVKMFFDANWGQFSVADQHKHIAHCIAIKISTLQVWQIYNVSMTLIYVKEYGLSHLRIYNYHHLIRTR